MKYGLLRTKMMVKFLNCQGKNFQIKITFLNVQEFSLKSKQFESFGKH